VFGRAGPDVPSARVDTMVSEPWLSDPPAWAATGCTHVITRKAPIRDATVARTRIRARFGAAGSAVTEGS